MMQPPRYGSSWYIDALQDTLAKQFRYRRGCRKAHKAQLTAPEARNNSPNGLRDRILESAQLDRILRHAVEAVFGVIERALDVVLETLPGEVPARRFEQVTCL